MPQNLHNRDPQQSRNWIFDGIYGHGRNNLYLRPTYANQAHLWLADMCGKLWSRFFIKRQLMTSIDICGAKYAHTKQG
jgi:hypothetical protein